MTKKELAARLAKSTDLSVAKALEVINHIFSADADSGLIPGALAGGDKVTIPGFGTFGTRTRPAREATKPSTGEKTKVPERTYVFFKVGKTLKEKIQ